MAPRFVSALACPASLKGVLSAREAAWCLAEGLARAGVETEQFPIADGGEGTAETLDARVAGGASVQDAFGRPREAPIWALADGTVVLQSADAIPLDPERLDVQVAKRRRPRRVEDLVDAASPLLAADAKRRAEEIEVFADTHVVI